MGSRLASPIHRPYANRRGPLGPGKQQLKTAMQQLQRQRVPTRPGYFAWLGAVAVVLLQLQLATHMGVDHDAGNEADETCEVCLKLDASGKVPTLAQSVIALPESQTATSIDKQATTPGARAWTRSARAPPQA